MTLRRAFLAVLLATAIIVASADAAQSPGSADLLAAAPCLVILLDNTADSPARDPATMATAARRVAQLLEPLPLAASVIVLAVGDPNRQIPLVKRWRIQARANVNGAPKAQVAAEVQAFLTVFPAGDAPDARDESHLIQGFFDAARLLNPNAPGNAIYFVSDLLERSPQANCYRDCKLPAPAFKLPPQTRVEGLGVGVHLPGPKAIALFKPWQAFFTQAGAGDLRLYRTY